MQWLSTISEAPDLSDAVDEASASIRERFGSEGPDLVIAFASEHHRDRYDEVPTLLQNRVHPRVLIGCSAGAVIGGGREVERRPGLSITAAALPGVRLVPFHLDNDDLPAAGEPPAEWQKVAGVTPADRPQFLLLPDPFTFRAEQFLHGLDAAFPDSPKVGGLASGARVPGGTALFMVGNVYHSGLVGLALCGEVAIDTVVAQGCRPIGEPMFVTRCQRNLLHELDGDSVGDRLEALYAGLDGRNRDLCRTSLFLGIVMRDDRQEYRQGDFLIRNLIGMDKDSGALAIGAVLRKNQVVQFHLRDARTSADDLAQMLTGYRDRAGADTARGSLLFSCLGRGEGLYGRPDHDTDSFRGLLGEVALGGFFCNGEIGPVQGRTFLHGYTSSFAIFRET